MSLIFFGIGCFFIFLIYTFFKYQFNTIPRLRIGFFIPLGALSFLPLASYPKSEAIFLFSLLTLLWMMSVMDCYTYTVYNLFLIVYALLSLASYLSFVQPPLSFPLETCMGSFLLLSLYAYLRKVPTIGFGDIIFISLTGLGVGLYSLAYGLLIACLTAFLWLGIRYFYQGISPLLPLPFFPFLSLGTYLAYLDYLGENTLLGCLVYPF